MPMPWMVKLGGSLGSLNVLGDWLKALRNIPVVIVPGGGIFADAVRSAQAQWHFDDRLAHRMAILAMRQYALMLSGIESNLTLASTETLLNNKAQDQRARCWLPDPDELQGPYVEASWRVTSDSLAVWLAQRLGAKDLLLVKSISLLERRKTADALIQDGIIDPAVPDFLENLTLNMWLSGPEDHDQLVEKLARPDRHFCRVER